MSLVDKKNNYDSDFCGSIPVNFINSIQPHGTLIVLDKDLKNIIQVSENIANLWDIEARELLNKPIEDLLDNTQIDAFHQKLQTWPVSERVPINLKLTIQEKSITFSTIVHPLPQYYLIELMKIDEHEYNISFMEIYQQIKYISLALKEAEDNHTIGKIAVEEIKKLSGFDKVMLYRFDKLWNGLVIAESKEEDMVSYMGLRFPASDVPRQSRELYLKNPYRLIPDTGFTAAKLVPVINPITQTFTDLASCNLRSVPKVHVEYLANMEVSASMSVPVILNNKLWGLISCHHKEPKLPSIEIISAIELLSTLISSTLNANEKENNLKYKNKADSLKVNIFEKYYSERNIRSTLITHSEKILDVFDASGISVVIGDNISSHGMTPQLKQTKAIVKWLKRYHDEKVFETESLPQIYEAAQQYKEVCSGLMSLNFSHGNEESYLILYRPEMIQTVEWGGNPNEAINFEDDGKTYHPRNSFNIWKETVINTSTPWSDEEVMAAQNLRIALLENLIEQ